MNRIWVCGALALLVGATGAAQAQLSTTPNKVTPNYMPSRPDAVKPNKQNLMQGPSYWTPGQRSLNVPGANTNPTQRETNPFNRTVLPPAPSPRTP
ncbi:hypothetical protein [Ancylobacter pratisalsi]|uniref:Uncharacterized protein n=1 Tax=Ancylobacter pratisalsi TaxID=1745854 RepID=A0A6P1YSD8_9HYPH|nr:hypothetical protein [Ancylobacter pratisalsi]QIB35606.1 hypothetical protein G3A50_19270 [Ancylobacter pratisalsi]